MAKKNSLDSFKEAKSALSTGNLNPICVVCGQEKFLADRLLDEIETLLPDSQKDFNYDLLYGKETTVDRILEIARSYPMMAEQRIVVVRDFLALGEKSWHPQNGDEETRSLDALIPYLQQPNSATLLVLMDTATPNGRTKIGKALKKGDHVSYYEFEEVPDYEIPKWIEQWVSYKYDKNVIPGVAEKLAQSVGNNLLVLAAEIDKVCMYAPDQTTINEELVQKVVGNYKEYSIFDLENAIAAHQVDQALKIADQMLMISGNATGEIFKSIGYFYGMFSKLWQIRRLGLDKLSKNEIQNKLGIGNSWYFNKLWKKANTFSMQHIHLAFEALLDADRAMKGFSKVDERGIFLMMIERLTRIPA